MVDPEEGDDGFHPPPVYNSFLLVKNAAGVWSGIGLVFLKKEYCVAMFGKSLQTEAIFDSKCVKSVWQPSSARARSGSLQRSQTPSWI